MNCHPCLRKGIKNLSNLFIRQKKHRANHGLTARWPRHRDAGQQNGPILINLRNATAATCPRLVLFRLLAAPPPPSANGRAVVPSLLGSGPRHSGLFCLSPIALRVTLHDANIVAAALFHPGRISLPRYGSRSALEDRPPTVPAQAVIIRDPVRGRPSSP